MMLSSQSKRFHLALLSGAAALSGALIACSTARGYDGADGGDAGVAGDTGSGDASGGVGAGSDGVAGAASGQTTGGVSGGGSDGEGSAGEGQAGNAGGADGGGLAGAGGSEECSEFTCCIGGRVFEPNEESPINVCDVCMPAQSQAEWTAAKDKVCSSETGLELAPKGTTLTYTSCGGSCSTEDKPLAAFSEIKSTGSNSITSRTYLTLNYGQIAPSALVNVTKATLRFYAQPSNIANAATVFVTSSTNFNSVCSVPLKSEYKDTLIECDVSTIVKAWLASTPETARGISLRASNGAPSYVRTELEANGLLRPVLILDYDTSCDGHTCHELTQ
jgi:hypothetical protein